jgi:hypothetical protein
MSFLETKNSNCAVYPLVTINLHLTGMVAHPQPFLTIKRTFGHGRFSQHQEKGALCKSRNAEILLSKNLPAYFEKSLKNKVFQKVNQNSLLPHGGRRVGDEGGMTGHPS